MHDGAPPHRAKFTASVLRELGIFGYFFDWPGNSPDCNPIENVWRIMKDKISRHRCRTNVALRIAIQEEWDAITSEEIASLVNSLPERVEAVRAVNGGHTKY
jgi:transposase